MSKKFFLILIFSFLFVRLIETAAPRPAYSIIYFERGLVADQQHDRPKALQLYKKAIYHNPRNPRPYEQLGRIAKEEGQTEEMITHYKKALDYGSRNNEVYLGLAQYFLETGNFKEAIKLYEICFDLGYMGAKEFYQFGLAYEREGLYLKAIESFINAAQRKNPYPEAAYAAGIAYYKAGDLTNAEKQIDFLKSWNASELAQNLQDFMRQKTQLPDMK